MRNLLSVIIYIAILVILAFTFAPFVILALILGFLYTVYTRYKLNKEVQKTRSIQEEMDKYEEPKENLAIIEAEYEEKTR